MTTPLTGGCLCGAIRYTVSAPVEKLIACHCTDCQHASGTGASINALLPSSALAFTKGSTKVFSKPADSGNVLNRHFCADCGSPVYSQRANAPEFLVLKVGGLDSHEGLRVAMNIWTRSRRPWTLMDTSIECHEGNRPIR
ncbi:MAG TPA: GFA family protein [Quisquiliibacterium sp.]|nr:GFA family protein [Quisquiliibacterium sp.]